MTRSLAALVSLLLLAVAVSGCLVGDDDKPEPQVVTDPVDDANNTTLGPVDPPTWTVGQWWAHHTFFGTDDATGTHFNVLVVSDEGQSYEVRSQSSEHALMDAYDDLFDLGYLNKADLGTTYNFTAWKWYDWPLEHNKTWNGIVPVEGTDHSVTYLVEESTAVRTAQGPKVGFNITGTDANGVVVIEYDYVPELGWFSDLEMYDPSGDPTTPVFRIQNMGFGPERTGEWYAYEVTDAINFEADSAGPSTESFAVGELTTQIDGWIEMDSDIIATLTITDPDGETVGTWTVDPASGPISEAVALDDLAVGEYQISFVGIGSTVSATLELDELLETVGSL